MLFSLSERHLTAGFERVLGHGLPVQRQGVAPSK
jgi:hypothetical protein